MALLNNIGIIFSILVALVTMIRTCVKVVRYVKALVDSHRDLVNRVEDMNKVIGGIADQLIAVADKLTHTTPN